MGDEKALLITALIDRVRRATEARGAKAQLARNLGVLPQTLNDWLANKKVPSGETTLQLLDWVTAFEAQQKDTGAALTAPVRKTRNTHPLSNESSKTGRKRR